MDKLSNLALLSQMLESAEKNIQSARQLLKEVIAGKEISPATAEKYSNQATETARAKAETLSSSASGGGRIIEGVFDGQNMIGPDGKKYPVPANYASKSKLVEGDVLKLTIADDGSFIYKQIGPVERKKIVGTLTQTESGEYRVIAEGKTYKVLLASLTYFKASPGDNVTVIVPEEEESEWAAVENVIGSGDEDDSDMEVDDDRDPDAELELDDDDDDDGDENDDQEEEMANADEGEVENFHV